MNVSTFSTHPRHSSPRACRKLRSWAMRMPCSSSRDTNAEPPSAATAAALSDRRHNKRLRKRPIATIVTDTDTAVQSYEYLEIWRILREFLVKIDEYFARRLFDNSSSSSSKPKLKMRRVWFLFSCRYEVWKLHRKRLSSSMNILSLNLRN